MKIKYLLFFFASAFLLSCSETIDTEDNNKDDEYKIEKVEFTESLENFVNPERGFYRFFETSTNNSSVLTQSYLDGIRDRKSTRLNSSHVRISYAVFCLKK